MWVLGMGVGVRHSVGVECWVLGVSVGIGFWHLVLALSIW